MVNNMKKVLIVALFVLIVCVSADSVQAYTSSKHNFSVDPPSGWAVDDTITFAVVVFYGPIEEGFQVNVNIQIESLPTSMTVKQYADAAKEILQTALSNFTLVSEGSRVINNVDAYELVFTFRQAAINVKEKQVYLVRNKKAYIVTYAALPTTYQKYLTAFESSVETFKILEPTAGAFLGLDWWLWVIIIAVVVGAVAAVVLLWRRRKAPVTPPPQVQPPPPQA